MAKMLRMSSSTSNTFLPASERLRLVQLSDDLLLSCGQIANPAMQEQSRFVEQPLRRPHFLRERGLHKRFHIALFRGAQRFGHVQQGRNSFGAGIGAEQPGGFELLFVARAKHEHRQVQIHTLREIGRIAGVIDGHNLHVIALQ